MAILKSKALILTLFLFSTITFAIRSPLPAGSPSDDMGKLLTIHGLPFGLFPNSVERVQAGNNGNMTVNLKDDCYVRLKYSNVLLHYQNIVTGMINFGTISQIQGLKMQQSSGWGVVTEMKYNVPDDHIEFSHGELSLVVLPMTDFTFVPTCLAFHNDGTLKIRSVMYTEV